MKPAVLFILAQFLFLTAFSQPRDLVKLIYADSFTGFQINGEPVREFTGNVHVERDGVNLYCDKMIEFVNRRLLEATGNVKIVQNADILTADFGRYYPDTRFITVEKNVKLNSEGNLLTSDFGNFNFQSNLAGFWSRVKLVDPGNNEILADSLDYNRNTGHSKLFRNVRIYSPADQSVITGQYAENFNTSRTAFIEKEAFLFQLPRKPGEDTLMIQSLKMESNRSDSVNRYVAVGKVRMVQGDLSARSDTMTFLKNEGKIRLRSEPAVWHGDNQVTGDSIDVLLEENKLKKLDCKGSAFSVSRKDSVMRKYDQLRGRRIQYLFSDKKLETVVVDTTAESLYYLDQDGKPSGANFITGDQIVIRFTNNEIEDIRVRSGVEGKFFPERLVAAEPILLKNFKWLGRERPTPQELRNYVRSGSR